MGQRGEGWGGSKPGQESLVGHRQTLAVALTSI